MIIYRAVNKINGKSYVGKTVSTLKERKRGHHKPCEWKRNPNSVFYKAIRKYGKESFEWYVVKECKKVEELNKLEIHFIEKFKSHIKENGYNMTLGGTGGDTLSNHPKSTQISKKKSKSMKGKNAGNKNAAKRPEVRKKISKTIKEMQQGGRYNPANKKWKITFPSGKVIVTEWFKGWCKENNMNYQSAVTLSNRTGKYKEYKIEKYE